MAKYYPYLVDEQFLRELDAAKNKQVFVRLTVLDIHNLPVGSIEGRATGGSLNKNGSSNVRVTGNVTIVADESNYQIENIDNIISLNKRVEVEIGYENVLHNKYRDYGVIWFPQGIMCITQPSVTHSTSSYTIALTLKDQMALLNGDLGGILPAAVEFSPMTVYDENNEAYRKPALVKDIIYTLVNELGGISKDKIFIRDLPERITNICSWAGTTTGYLVDNGGGQSGVSNKVSVKEVEGRTLKEYYYGDIMGYSPFEFVYPGNLAANPGDSIASVLDKIKNTLGNYEYFFDVNGNFIFQQIRNYLNVGSAIENLTDLLDSQYFINESSGKSVYQFNDTNLITAVQNTPQYTKIKNDINVWGKRNNEAIRYHAVIDKKPEIEIPSFHILLKQDPIDTVEEIVKARYGGKYYAVAVPSDYQGEDDKTISTTNMDWRLYLYLIHVTQKDTNDYVKGPYAEELYANLPLIMDLSTLEDDGSCKWFAEEVSATDPARYWEMPYFLDIIDSVNPAINQFNVSKIGRKTAIIKQDSVNCMFGYNPNAIPDVMFFAASDPQTETWRETYHDSGKQLVQVRPDIFNRLMNKNVTDYSALECLRSNLHEYISYNENISLTTLPIFYLEPNTRISVTDRDASVSGDYMIKSISVPLTTNGTMTIQASKALERL